MYEQQSLTLERVRLSLRAFDDLAAGRAGAGEVRLLLGSERSRRLLLLQHLVAQCREKPELLAPLGGVEPVRDLLDAVEQREPGALHGVLDYPTVGMWIAHTVRLVEGALPAREPLWTHVGVLSAVAVSAALRCRLAFSAAVPASDGRVFLPGYGSADTGADVRGPSVAIVTADSSRVTVSVGDHAVEVSFPLDCDRPGWRSVPVVRAAGAAGRDLSVHLDAVDPAPQVAGLPAPRHLGAADRGRWAAQLVSAWQLIERDHPRDAEALGAGLRLIVPVDAADAPNFLAGSTPDGFGAAALRLPDSTADLACALVHEFQHSVLNGLLNLVDLHAPDRDGPVHYAPWRDDPRPFLGILHGAYAFTAVAAFWRTRLERDAGYDRARAELEYAFWRRQTGGVLDRLAGSSALTGIGHRMVQLLRARVASWREELLDEDADRLAVLAALSHQAGWRAHHMQTDPAWVEAAAASWIGGAAAPPEPARSGVVRDPRACGLGRMFVLARHRWSGSTGPAREALESARADDPRGADRRLVGGDPHGAVELYLAVLAETPDDPRPWAGLGPALAATGASGADAAAVTALLGNPERVRAVHRRLSVVAGNRRTNVLALAGWLGPAS